MKGLTILMKCHKKTHFNQTSHLKNILELYLFLMYFGRVARSSVKSTWLKSDLDFTKPEVKYLVHPVCTKQVHHWFSKP